MEWLQNNYHLPIFPPPGRSQPAPPTTTGEPTTNNNNDTTVAAPGISHTHHNYHDGSNVIQVQEGATQINNYIVLPNAAAAAAFAQNMTGNQGATVSVVVGHNNGAANPGDFANDAATDDSSESSATTATSSRSGSAFLSRFFICVDFDPTNILFCSVLWVPV